jgi:hypothetical protein
VCGFHSMFCWHYCNTYIHYDRHDIISRSRHKLPQTYTPCDDAANVLVDAVRESVLMRLKVPLEIVLLIGLLLPPITDDVMSEEAKKKNILILRQNIFLEISGVSTSTLLYLSASLGNRKNDDLSAFHYLDCNN